MRVLIAGNDDVARRRIVAALVRNGVECPSSCAVALESAIDHAARAAPELMVLDISVDTEAGLEVVREIHNAVRSHILLVGPASDPKLILRALREGADEFLDREMLEEELAAALVRLKSRHAAPQEPESTGRLISVLAPSGGSGSSILSANLATVLAKEHKSCGLIDLRLGAGDLAGMFHLRPTHTIADLCENLARLDKSMFEQFFDRHECGVHLLAAPGRIMQVDSVSPKVMRQILMMTRGRFPYVVVDLDNRLGSEQVEVLSHSDVIFVIMRLDYTSLRNTRRATDLLMEIGVGLERVKLVVNRHRQPKQLSVMQAEEALSMKVEHLVPDDPRRINSAVNDGVPVVLQQPRSSISKSIAQMAAIANGHLPN